MADQRFALSRAFWFKVASVAGVYLLLQALILLVTGVGWQKFWVLQLVENFQYWDAVHYATLAVNPVCGAFYLLWPALVRQIAAPVDVATAMSAMILGSELIFLGSLPLALFTFERIVRNRSLALLAFVLYALGPNAIFYAIGYTESLFSFLSLLFLLSLYTAEQLDFSEDQSKGRLLVLYGTIFGLSVGLNLLRPALLQSWFAIAFSLTTLLLLRRLSPSTARDTRADRVITLTLLIGTGSAFGYALYGLFCWNTVGNFWGPFQAQVEWGRALAFRPWLLLLPRSLLMDLHALYAPALIFLTLGWLLFAGYCQRQQMTLRLPRQPWLYLFLVHPLVFSGMMVVLSKFAKQWTTAISIRSPEKVLSELGSFTVLYAIAFSGVHSIINFLVNSGYLYSTARHYFGSPYAFIGIGAVLAALAVPQLNRLAWVMAAVGLIWLGDQWLHYGTGQWLG
ncbi:hypothetical protein [Leptolyngbya sp. BC1307]|uniref:hypothetical protein n=1 Tax=Leptolyngbya sp. BC1307 TaxID=2029589 RepID=UPI001140F01A|nr:hypothetical protein [Leptolyngbya sp. BC1307]